MTNNVARHTIYILINEHGKLELVEYNPNQSYIPKNKELHITILNHDIWLGDVICHRIDNGKTLSNLRCKVVAKKQHLVNKTTSIGIIKNSITKSYDFDQILNRLTNQNKPSLV